MLACLKCAMKKLTHCTNLDNPHSWHSCASGGAATERDLIEHRSSFYNRHNRGSSMQLTHC
jgi:hypothetical protein